MKKNTRKVTRTTKGRDFFGEFRWLPTEPMEAVVPLDTGEMYLGSTRGVVIVYLLVGKFYEGQPVPGFGLPHESAALVELRGWPSPTTPYYLGMAQTTDGGVIAGVQGNGVLGMACLTAAGDLNPAFGNGGRIIHDMAVASRHHKHLAPRQSGGAGTSGALIPAQEGGFYALYSFISSGESGLTRIRPDGQIDTSFGDGGRVTVRHSPTTETIARGIVASGLNHVVVFGIVRANDGVTRAFAARYGHDGSLDTNFGSQGFAVAYPYPASAEVNLSRGAVSANGSIFLCGKLRNHSGDQSFVSALICAFDERGDILTSFNGGNPTELGVLGYNMQFEAGLIIQEDQQDGSFKILAGGTTRTLVTPAVLHGLVARYLSDGTLDKTGFGAPDGYLNHQPFGFNSHFRHMALDKDGVVLIAGLDDGGGILTLMDGA